MAMRNAEVVDLLQRIGDLMELKGDEAFKVRAYREAARQLDSVVEEIDMLAAEERLTEVKGIGASIARTIKEFLDTGTSRQLEHLRAQVPESLIELLGIRHFGPPRIYKVHQALGINTLDELEAAARDGRLQTVPGFGAKSAEQLLVSIARFRERRRLKPRYQAEAAGKTAMHALRQIAAIERVELVGQIRRMAESAVSIDLLAAADEPADVLDAFERLPLIRDVVPDGGSAATGLTREQYPIRVNVVPERLWALGLLYSTGSAAHYEQLVERARAVGLRIAQPGEAPFPAMLLELDGAPLAAEDEAAIYARLGLPWIPPELREGRGEVSAALTGRLPHLIELGDVRGDLHIHSNWSDGADSIEDMAREALALGREYIAFADHSQSLGVARGLSLERLAEQRAEIARVDSTLDGIQLLSSVELDIRHDGTLDYPDEVLAQFDLVTASIHSGFQQPGEKLTQRVIAAMHSPHVDSIGHLTGRVLGWRDPLDMDVEAILQAAAETGTAMEINAWPNRLDVHEEHARRAKELGVKLVINTDSHAADQLAYMHFGVEIARRAWLESEDVLNTLPLDQLRAYLRSRPHKAG